MTEHESKEKLCHGAEYNEWNGISQRKSKIVF